LEGGALGKVFCWAESVVVEGIGGWPGGVGRTEIPGGVVLSRADNGVGVDEWDGRFRGREEQT